MIAIAVDLRPNDGSIVRPGRLTTCDDWLRNRDNQVATCIWQKRYSRENREAIGDAHEYLLVYARDPDAFKRNRNLIPPTEKQAAVYKNPNNDPKGPWQSISMTAQGFRPNQMYEIVAPNGKRHTPPEGRCWSVIESEYRKLQGAGRVYFGKDGNGVPRIIRYLSDVPGIVPWTWWPHEEVGHTDEARKEIQSIFGTQTAFDTPKPVRLLERVFRIALKPGDTVLDFFAGSGTTAHAVARLNAEDGGARRFILVSNTEATDAEPGKNLCRDVCAERVRRVLGGYTNAKGEQVAGLGGGFAYLHTRRIAPYRVATRVAHDEVWRALQLIADRPLTRWQRHGFQADGGLGYLADFRAASLAALADWLGDTRGAGRTLYAWNLQRAAPLAPEANLAAIPDFLSRRFGR